MANFTMYDREREFKWQIECQLSNGKYAYIEPEDIYSGRLTRQISSGEGIEIGSCYVSELDLTIVASALPANVVSVKPYFRLLTSTEIVDNVMKKYYTPYNLGVFKIASTKRKEYGRIDLVCYDKMADLDTLITSAAYTELLASDWKPFYLLDWIATKVGVTYTFTQAGIEAMPNGTLYFKLAEETSNIKTYRDLLQYVCMLIGTYGIFDEDGHLNIKTFADVTSYSLPASFRFSESFSDVPISYSGVELTVKNVTTMFGNANNTVVRLSDNPFLYNLSTLNQTTDYATFIMLFLRNIYTEFQGLSYYAGEFEIPPDASLNVGRLLAVTGGGASDTINCFLQKIDVNFDDRMSLSCGNPNTYVTRTQNRTTSSITNLTNRIETLESSQGTKEVYYGTTLPTTDIGQDSSLYYKIIQRPEDLKTLNVVEYIQSETASCIPTDILMTNNTRIMMRGIFYQGDYNGGQIAFGTYGNDLDGNVGRFVAGTSAFRSKSNCFFFFGDDYFGYKRSCEGIYGTDVMVMADTATRTFAISGGGASHSVTVPSTFLYTPSSTPIGILCANMSSEAGGFAKLADWRAMNANAIIKRFQVYYNNVLAYDLIPVQNANDVADCGLYDRMHRKYYPGANYYNHTPFTAGTPTGEVINQLDECVEAGYLRVNDEWWEIYNGGTEYFAGNYIEITENNVITSTLKAGTNIQIADDGTISASGAEIVQTVTSGTQLATINDKPIYAPTVSATQTQTSGTEIGNITVGNTNTKLYAPTTTVTQTLTEGTEIAQVNGTSLYAPSSKIISHTTAEWESLGTTTVSESGVLYVYTDYKQDESGKNIPGFKMGDGNAYVADLPFSSAMFDMHMNNTDIHITAAEREKWNNKVSVLMNEPNNNLFFITG